MHEAALNASQIRLAVLQPFFAEQEALNIKLLLAFNIGVGSGAAGAALAAPIFCLVAVLGPRFFFRYASCLFYNPDIEILRARFARGCF